MSVKLKTIKSSGKILTLDSEALPEIIDINDQFFTLKVFYSLILNNSTKNPLQYTKVKLTFISQQQNFQSANVKEYSEDFSSTSVKRNIAGKKYQINSTTSNFSQNSSFKKVFSVKPRISPASQAKYDVYSKLIDNFSNKPGEINSIASKSILIGDKIVKALKEQVHFTDLVLPDFVSIYQEKRYSNSQGVTFQDFKNELVRENLSISQIVFNHINDSINFDSHFSRQLIDSVLQSNRSQVNNQSLDYYVKQRSARYLDTLTLSDTIKLPIRLLQEGNIFLKLSLLTGNNPNTEDETLTSSINLTTCLEAYYNNLQSINANVSKTHVDNLVNSVSISPLLSVADENKIQGFNLYIKNFSSSNKEKFSFVKSMAKNEVYTEFFDTISNYQAVYRLKPVTAFGESNIFSDVLFSTLPNQIGQTRKSLIFYARQININNIELNLRFSNAQNVNKLKVYRRDCTNSPDAEFIDIITVNTIPANTIVLNDAIILPGHFYEYYIEVFDVNNSLLDITLPQVVEVKYINLDTYSVELSDTITNNDSIQFNIGTTKLKKNSKIDFLKAEENKLTVVQSTQQISTEEKDFEETVYHKVTRIDNSSGQRESFDITTNGTFVDNQETQTQSGITPLISGRLYTYEVESYKRNPVNLTKRFLSTGTTDRGKQWFYSPSKWKSPNVINTGILQSDDDSEFIRDLFMSDFIGITSVQNIKFNTADNGVLAQSVDVERLTRNMIKILWSSEKDAFDCFIVSKVVNGKKFIVGTTSESYMYHNINFDSDIGTIYYEIIPVKNDYTLGDSITSNSFLISPDIVDKI